MKSKGKKFLSALLVSSMVLTSSMGFMPRPTEAVSESTVYSYDFEYINESTEKGNRKIVIKFEDGKDLKSIDSTKISMLGDTTSSIGQVSANYTDEEVSIVVDGIDPSELSYSLKVEAGAFEFKNYQQLEDIVINFKSYDITPDFKSIFKDAEEANALLDRNELSEIILHVDSDYITDIVATKNEDANLTTIGVKTTDDVDSVKIEVVGISGDNTRETSTKTGTNNEFQGNFAGLSGVHVINVTAYDVNGKELDEQAAKNDFSTSHGTNFNTNNVSTFDSAGYIMQDIIDGTVSINDVIAGKSYDELDEINVQYAKADNIFSVATAEELANALAEIKGLSGKTATIKLTEDITVGREAVFENDERLTIKGSGHTITGDVQLGNDNDKVVRLVDVNVVGNLEVNVGDAGDAYLTNVIVTVGKLLVTSGDFSSVYLTGVVAPKLEVKNLKPVHIVAVDGTIIDTTELVKPTDGNNGDVKLTMAGGSFGSNIFDKMSNATLFIEGKTFEKVTIDSIAVTPVVRLLKNTEITELVANKDVTMTGEDSSTIIKSSDSKSVITYDGFTIEDADSSTDYIGTNVPGSSGKVADSVTIPTSNDNTITLGGTMVTNNLTTNDFGEDAYLTLTLDGNVNWKTTLLKDTADLVALTKTTEDDGATYIANSNIGSIELLNSKTLKITFDTFTLVAGTSLKYTLDSSNTISWNNLVDPDASMLGTSDWGGTDGTTKLDYTASLYKPVVQGTGTAVVYAYQEMKDTGFVISADKDLTTVTITNATTNLDKFEYSSNDANWTSFTTAGAGPETISTLFAGIGDNETKVLNIRVKDSSEASDVVTYNLKKNEPWILSGEANVKAALVDADVTGIWVQGGAYDSSATAITKDEFSKMGQRTSAFEVRLQGSTDAVITVPMGVADTKIENYTGVEIVGDTTAPTDFDTLDAVGFSFDNSKGTVAVPLTASFAGSAEGGRLEVAFAKSIAEIDVNSVYKTVNYGDLSTSGVANDEVLITSIEEQDDDLNIYYRLVDYAENGSTWILNANIPNAPTAATIPLEALKNTKNYISATSKGAVTVSVTTPEVLALVEIKDESGHTVKTLTETPIAKAIVVVDAITTFVDGDDLTIIAKAVDQKANISKSAEFAAEKYDVTAPTLEYAALTTNTTVPADIGDVGDSITLTFSEDIKTLADYSADNALIKTVWDANFVIADTIPLVAAATGMKTGADYSILGNKDIVVTFTTIAGTLIQVADGPKVTDTKASAAKEFIDLAGNALKAETLTLSID